MMMGCTATKTTDLALRRKQVIMGGLLRRLSTKAEEPREEVVAETVDTDVATEADAHSRVKERIVLSLRHDQMNKKPMGKGGGGCCG